MAYSANLIPTMTSATTPSGVASSSSDLAPDYAAWKAFNHSIAVEEDLWYAAYQSATGWLQYQFPVARTVTRYAIDLGAWGSYGPKTFTFKGSNDGTNWTTLDTQTNITDWSSRRVFDFANAVAYAYYRLDITEGNNATYLGVGELEMMETVTYLPGIMRHHIIGTRGVILHG